MFPPWSAGDTPPLVALVGAEWDEMSSYLCGACQGPPAIRHALFSGSANVCTEMGRDLAVASVCDAGDVKLESALGVYNDDGEPLALGRIAEHIEAIVDAGARPLTLGGDHAITLGCLRACVRHWAPLTVFHVDAHPDLYEDYDGNRYSHACPFARALEEGLIRRLVQVGIRTMNPHQRRQVERYGVEVIEARQVRAAADLRFDGPLYVSIDLDGLDPAFAPGVSHHEPGGLSTRQVLDLIQRLPANLVGADVVELNPSRDVMGMTAMVAAKLAKELVGKLLDSAETEQETD